MRKHHLLVWLLHALLASSAVAEGDGLAIYRGKTANQWARQLGDQDVAARWYAAYALGQLGPQAAPWVDALAKTLGNRGENEYVRGSAARALGCIGPAAESAVALLADTSASEHHLSVRRQASWALGRIGAAAKPAVEALLKRLDDQDVVVRVYAAVSVWQIERHAKAIPALVAIARRGEGPGVCQAAAALGELGPAAEPAIPVLVELLRQGDEDVSRAAAASLGRLGPGVLAAVKGVLGAPQESARQRAVEVLEQLGPAAVPILIEALANSNPLARRSAARALGRLGPAAREAMPALLEAVNDKDQPVRETAAEAIKQVRAEETSPADTKKL